MILKCNLFLLWVIFLTSSSSLASVTYDGKSLIINGQRRILISGSIHYPRSTPEMWPDLIQKAKAGGLDVIETYVFWNGHEPTRGNYYFEDRYDLVKFVKLIQQAGLYVHLRIGPFICAEWNFGGFPVWLKYVPGIELRTNNGAFKVEMEKFTRKIVDLMKSQSLFESQGGPIILSQIENEYGPVEWDIGEPGRAYTKWFSQMAVGLNTGVPWVMCKQETAPDPIIDTCNGFYCENFKPNRDYKPKMFTENWTGWYTSFGGAVPYRPAEDLAFSVLRFIQNNGSLVNYYMYHGGTNFGRSSGLFIATSYDYDAPIDEYGLVREPKWSHLRNMHRAIKKAEPAILSTYPTVYWPGKNLEVHVFQSKNYCAAFLANYNKDYSSTVTFWNKQYDLPAWSISILPDCKSEVFNTAKVYTLRKHAQMIPISGSFPWPWHSYSERMVTADDTDIFTRPWLVEQVDVTKDYSDYLWYTTNVYIDSGEAFLKSGKYPVLEVKSAGHVLHVFINWKYWGTVYGSLNETRLTFSKGINLIAGNNKISLLSVSVGMANVGTHFDRYKTGVLGPVTLYGLNKGPRDLTKEKWSFKVGMRGESLSLHTQDGSSSSSVEWLKGSSLTLKQPLTWYKTYFDAPGGNEPLALDMGTMGKGEIWVNGRSIGRHWPGYIAKGQCGNCNYKGTYYETKCLSNCGQPSQKWYHVPRSWLKPTGNLLVVFEEMGGDPSGISLVKRQL